jgi:hypothetical protein
MRIKITVDSLTLFMKTVPFDIYIPATKEKEAVKVATIQIEVYDVDGVETITPESSELIDKIQSHYIKRACG